MNKEQQKDKIIEIVKKAIDDNKLVTYGEDDIISLESNDVDHIAEEVAENVYNFYRPINEVAEYKPDEERRKGFFDRDNQVRILATDIKELKDKNAELKRERDEYYAQADRLQEKLAQVLMRVDKTKEWTLNRAKTEGAKELAEKVKNLLLVTYGDYGSPLCDITGEDIVCDIDELLEEYTE